MAQTLVRTARARVLLAAVVVFAFPALGLAFAGLMQAHQDAQFLERMSQSIEANRRLSAAQKAALEARYQKAPLSVACRGSEAERLRFSGDLWEACAQHHLLAWIRQVSWASVALGLASALLIALSSLAARSRSLEHPSLLVGWNGLKVAGALLAVTQGALAVLLSYWLIVLKLEVEMLNLDLAPGLLIGATVLYVVVALFRRRPGEHSVEGERVERRSAPELWARLRELCIELQTELPDHLVAGIDDHLFVTEGKVLLGDATLEGRTLYLSLSLLRQLRRSEADALFAHELAHLAGGDAEQSKKLAQTRMGFGQHLRALEAVPVTRPLFHFLDAYDALFALGLARSWRRRELQADATAAKVVSAEDLARALVKASAYSSYRRRAGSAPPEATDPRGEKLGTADRVPAAFVGYARSLDLREAIVPHPFDTHPPLEERLANLGMTLTWAQLEALLLEPVTSSWIDAIPGGAELERRLWESCGGLTQDRQDPTATSAAR